MANINFKILKNDKEILMKNKIKYKETYVNQIKRILDYYRRIPLEELAEIVLLNHEIYNKKNLSTITIKEIHLVGEEYYKKVYYALLTKLPKMEYKDLYTTLFHVYLKRN